MSTLRDDTTPGPRRSAISTTSPAEQGQTSLELPEQAQSWLEHHKRTLVLWGVGVLVVALIILLGAYAAGRVGSGSETDSPTDSQSPSVSIAPAATIDDLISVEDADKIVAGAGWNIIRSTDVAEEATARAGCLGVELTDVNPTDTLQRTMGTSQDDQLAVLHQIDVYASADAASQVQAHRVQMLSACDEVPAHIEAATTITGLGDEASQLTVSFQDDPAAFHTILLVRSGRALTILDVTRNATAVPVDGAVAALGTSLSSICSGAEGTCPTEPTVAAAVPAPVEPVGWLITSDLPRVTPGFGRWTVLDSADITSQGTGCENLTLATEPGPTSRAQRTYALTQDENTPEVFGIDEMAFEFADNAAAQAFSTKLVDNLLGCKERGSLTATISDQGSVEGAGAEGAAVSARLITIDQALSDSTKARYQLIVAIADTRVSYVLVSATEDYQFTEQQSKDLALRTAQRASQI